MLLGPCTLTHVQTNILTHTHVRLTQWSYQLQWSSIFEGYHYYTVFLIFHNTTSQIPHWLDGCTQAYYINIYLYTHVYINALFTSIGSTRLYRSKGYSGGHSKNTIILPGVSIHMYIIHTDCVGSTCSLERLTYRYTFTHAHAH